MAINPFGDESNSIHAWKARYRQLEKEKNILAQTVSEIRYKLDTLTAEHEQLIENNNISEAELSKIRQEMMTYRELSKDRANEIKEMEQKMDANSLKRLQQENIDLRNKVDELVGQLSRGTVDEQPTKESQRNNTSELFNALIPVILHNYDKSNPNYADSFKNLIEVSISEGDVLTQIIAILYKYGGDGPIDRVRDLVSDKAMFQAAIDILLDEKIISKFDETISIYVKSQDMSDSSNWVSLSIEELMERMEDIVSNGSPESIAISLDNFRDILTEKGTPVATIFFEIRKLKEGIQKNKLNRKDAIEKVEIWKSRLLN